MVAGVPDQVVVVGAVILLLILAQSDDTDSPGNYNRGVLQQTSPEKLRKYVARIWTGRGYETRTGENSGEYVDVIAESANETVVISVRRQPEEGAVSADAVQRFRSSAGNFESDGKVMMSTSYFTQKARETASRADIELIEGDEFAEMLTEHDGIPG
jgi:restriction endonuclease Mrr